jgi:t-SNARE complex subunit (syntaxin)
MVDGRVEEQKQTQYQLQPMDIKIANETDLYGDIINDRQKQIKDMADVMGNINQIASDIALETNKQGEKLHKLDDEMEIAEENADKGLEELNKAQAY